LKKKIWNKGKFDLAWDKLMVLSEKITRLWKGPGAVEEIREQREKKYRRRWR